jgi:hypothetical protein
MRNRNRKQQSNIDATIEGGIRTGRKSFDAAPITVIVGGGSALPAPQPTAEGRNRTSSRTSINSPYETRGFSAKVAAAINKRPIMLGKLAQFVSDMHWVLKTLGGRATLRALRRGLRELGWCKLDAAVQSFEVRVRLAGLTIVNGNTVVA